LLEDDQQQNGTNKKMYQEQTIQVTKLIHGLDQAKKKMALKRQA